jgi:hypothetical protein
MHYNLFYLVDGSTSPGSKMQIEMDTTSSHSPLSFGTYSYQYTRGIDVQQVIIKSLAGVNRVFMHLFCVTRFSL